MKYDREFLGRENCGIQVIVDRRRVGALLQVAIVEPLIREFEDGVVRSEVLGQFHNTARVI